MAQNCDRGRINSMLKDALDDLTADSYDPYCGSPPLPLEIRVARAVEKLAALESLNFGAALDEVKAMQDAGKEIPESMNWVPI